MMIELYLARRYLFRGRAKHISFIGIVACLGVTVGVAALIIVISVMNGFDRDLMDRLLKFNYHLNIFSAENNILPQVKNFVDKIALVENTSLIAQTQIFAKIDKYVYPLYVKGIDFSNESERKLFFSYVKEDSKIDGFFVGEGLKSRLAPFEQVEYYPLDKTFKLKTEKIRGFFRMGLYDIDNVYIITDLEKARSLSENYTLSLGIRLKNPYDATSVKNAIKHKFTEGVYINTWMDNQVLLSALKLEKLTMFVLLSLITLVASFNIFATLTVKVVEKTKDIGILKALGFTSRRILAIFSLQGLLLGFIGVLSGTALGLGLCLLLQKYHFIKIPVGIYAIEHLPIYINYRDIVFIALLGLLFSFISSLFPAIRASKLPPSEALRYE
ncbi:MAG: ABC transporter permease [Candidatus Omnitrophota bacterium]|nr:ABC transporter permease [Candidatus Omnitrophota bacterium]